MARFLGRYVVFDSISIQIHGTDIFNTLISYYTTFKTFHDFLLQDDFLLEDIPVTIF